MNTKPAIIITYPFPLGAFNGGARSTREIALQIGRRGIPVYLIAVSLKIGDSIPRSPAEPSILGYDLDQPFAENNVHIIRVEPHKIDAVFDGIAVRREVEKIVAERPVSAVISYFSEAFYLPDFLEKKDIPFTIFAIWQSYDLVLIPPNPFRHPLRYFFSRWRRRNLIRTYQRAAHHFAISDQTGQELTEHLFIDPAKITTTYLGVSDIFFQIERPKPEKISRFLFFGRIIKLKGVADAIEAFQRLKRRGYHDWEFYLNGPGNHDWAQSLIHQAGLEQQVFLQEPTNDSDLLNDLRLADLVILPSYDESFGLSFAEAQAASLPVIGYAVGSVPEVVAAGETGCLAPLGNIERLTDLLVDAIENPEKAHKMGLAGRERVRQLFRWEKTADTILNTLKHIGENH